MPRIVDNTHKGLWLHDRTAYDEETIAFLNEAFREAAAVNPKLGELIWQLPENTPELKLTYSHG